MRNQQVALEKNVLGKEVLCLFRAVCFLIVCVCSYCIVLSSILLVQLALKEAEQHTAIALALSNKNAAEAKSLADHNVIRSYMHAGVIFVRCFVSWLELHA